MDLTFGIVISTVLSLSIVWDILFVGIFLGFFLLAIAYLAVCESLRKGAKE